MQSGLFRRAIVLVSEAWSCLRTASPREICSPGGNISHGHHASAECCGREATYHGPRVTLCAPAESTKPQDLSDAACMLSHVYSWSPRQLSRSGNHGAATWTCLINVSFHRCWALGSGFLEVEQHRQSPPAPSHPHGPWGQGELAQLHWCSCCLLGCESETVPLWSPKSPCLSWGLLLAFLCKLGVLPYSRQ